MATPAVARLDQHGGGVLGLMVDPLDPSAQLSSRPQRVDQLEVIVDKERGAERRERVEHPPLDGMNVGSGSSLWHPVSTDE
jgi:hypothetical protein